MEEDKSKKISLSTFFLLLSIIAIIAMGIFMYKLNNDKTAEIKKSTELQTQINSLNETNSKLQKEINNISDTAHSNTPAETNTSSGKTTETNTTSNNDTKTESNYSKEYKKIIEKIEKTENKNSDVNLTCDLIYFNNDDIPDLVIGNLGHWVSLYMYENGTVYNPINKWVYGAGGNTGYEYQEKRALIRNYNSDYAGAIITTSLFVLNSNRKFDSFSNTQRGTTGENIDTAVINETLESYGGYYYNENKITEQEYNSKLKKLSIDINGTNFKELSGSKSVQEIKKQL